MSIDIDRTMGGRGTIRDVLFDAERRLAAVGVPSPSIDAAEIVAFAMGTTRSHLILLDPIGSVSSPIIWTRFLTAISIP